MATEIKVGLAGFGNVGKGTYDILKRNHSLSGKERVRRSRSNA